MRKWVVGVLLFSAILALAVSSEDENSSLERDTREVRDNGETSRHKTNSEKKNVVKRRKERNNKHNRKTVSKASKKSKKSTKNSEKETQYGQNRQSGSAVCDASTVLLAVTYLNLYNGKVKNFNSQAVRIAKFSKLGDSKVLKNTTYMSMATKLAETGGGNTSALACQGNASLPGTALLNSTYVSLNACQAQIIQACGTSKPAYNQSTMDEMNATMSAFSSLVSACLLPTAACSCWNSVSLANASAAVSSVDITSLNTQLTNFKKACTSAVGACNQAQNTASNVLYGCSSQNSPSVLTARLQAATVNQNALQQLLSNSTPLYSRQSLTCTGYASGLQDLASLALASPLSPSVASTSNSLFGSKPSSCTSSADKASIFAALNNILQAIASIIIYISSIQSNLGTITGTTASIATIQPITGLPAIPTTAATTLSSVSTASTGSSTASPATSSSTSSSTYNCACGTKGVQKIVGGQNAQINEWPWNTAISYSTTGAAQNYGCGATLVADQWMVTASHCFVDTDTGKQITFEKDITVVLGDYDRSTLTETTNRLVLTVSKIILHPNYSYSTYLNDIALIKLSTKVNLSAYTPACLPPAGADYTGKIASAYGWGTTQSGGSQSNILQEVELNIISRTSCAATYAATSSIKISPGMVCTYTENKDTCQGDSGGPITVPNTNNKHVLVGATSFGIGCAREYPGVYAEISYYTAYIQSQIAANGGAVYCPA